MIACFAWTNTQILNITNAVANNYAEEEADLFIRVGTHISEDLVNVIRSSGVFKNIYCMDPVTVKYKRVLKKLPNIRNLFIAHAYKRVYSTLLDKLCAGKSYSRVLVAWFYTENVFLIDYWHKCSKDIKITFIDEGTGSYYYTKRQMCFPLSLISNLQLKFKKIYTEGHLARRYAKRIDSILLYAPDLCRPDIDWKKGALKPITENGNPVMWGILKDTASSLDNKKFKKYSNRKVIYFSSYSVDGSVFENKSIDILNSAIEIMGEGNMIAKIHTGNTLHAENFALSLENTIYVDRDRYLFESLFSQLEEKDDYTMMSCISTTAFYPKFMFGVEPRIVLTYRLYDRYRNEGKESDDWLAQKLVESYEDKSKVLIPNSMFEFRELLRNIPKYEPETEDSSFFARVLPSQFSFKLPAFSRLKWWKTEQHEDSPSSGSSSENSFKNGSV